MNKDEEVDDSTILKQLGTPIIDVATELGACLMYGGVEEIGNHMPEKYAKLKKLVIPTIKRNLKKTREQTLVLFFILGYNFFR